MKTASTKGYQSCRRSGMKTSSRGSDSTRTLGRVRAIRWAEGRTDSMAARIVAIADAFDAMTTNRPYQKAMPFDRRSRGCSTQRPRLDRRVVAAFAESYKAGAFKEPAKAAAYRNCDEDPPGRPFRSGRPSRPSRACGGTSTSGWGWERRALRHQQAFIGAKSATRVLRPRGATERDGRIGLEGHALTPSRTVPGVHECVVSSRSRAWSWASSRPV